MSTNSENSSSQQNSSVGLMAPDIYGGSGSAQDGNRDDPAVAVEGSIYSRHGGEESSTTQSGDLTRPSTRRANERPLNPRSTSPAPIPDQQDETVRDSEPCGVCERVVDNPSFCCTCELIFCDPCWDGTFAHRSKCVPTKDNSFYNPGHEKLTVRGMRRMLRRRNDQRRTEEEVTMLHLRDRHTTWFGISISTHPTEGSTPRRYVLQTTRRLQDLLEPALVEESRASTYPSIVTFVGEACAGKSTLIKALIEITGFEGIETPVAVKNITGAGRRTSADVHLYADPQTLTTPTPILFADCEGLESSSWGPEPSAEQACNSNKDEHNISLGSTKELYKDYTLRLQDRYRPVLRDMRTWKLEGSDGRNGTSESVYDPDRRHITTYVYPCFLYPFSDTIVYVWDNPRTSGRIVEKLLEWGDSAIQYGGVNKSIFLPSVLIVFNNIDLDPNERENSEQRTDKFLKSLSKKDGLENNVYTAALAEKCRSLTGATITTVLDLLRQYYAEIRVLAMPSFEKQPNLFDTQLDQLYQEIKTLSADASARKRTATIDLSYTQLVPRLNRAFDHLLESPNTPGLAFHSLDSDPPPPGPQPNKRPESMTVDRPLKASIPPGPTGTPTPSSKGSPTPPEVAVNERTGLKSVQIDGGTFGSTAMSTSAPSSSRQVDPSTRNTSSESDRRCCGLGCGWFAGS